MSSPTSHAKLLEGYLEYSLVGKHLSKIWAITFVDMVVIWIFEHE